MFSCPISFSYSGHYGGNLPVPLHAHRGVELVFVIKGKCITEFAGKIQLSAKEGTIYVTPPHLMHVQRNLTTDCETYYSVMEISGNELDTSLRTVDASEDPLLRQWFHNLYDLNSIDAREEASWLLAAVWSRISAIETKGKLRKNRHPALVRAMDYMDRHYSEALTISGIARETGISQSHMNALFRKETGAGAEEHLTAIRMKHARHLLLNRYLSIAEAGAMAGYPDANYFSRRFRLFHGITPRTYRDTPSIYMDHADIGAQ